MSRPYFLKDEIPLHHSVRIIVRDLFTGLSWWGEGRDILDRLNAEAWPSPLSWSNQISQGPDVEGVGEVDVMDEDEIEVLATRICAVLSPYLTSAHSVQLCFLCPFTSGRLFSARGEKEVARG